VVRELRANDVVERSENDEVGTVNATMVVVVVVVVVQLRANFKLAGLYLLGYKPAHDFIAVGL
jgi:hypothetical protein